jgi:primosomal protein N' (replication factor Y)
LLVQSGGRAGRGEKPGRVLIQTRDTNHYCWQHIQSGDYAAFYADEIKRRRLRRYPPFVCLALLRVSFTVDDANGPPALGSFAADIRARARELDVQALGPAPAPLPILRGRRRFHCLLKADGWQSIRRLYFDAKAHKTSRTLRLFLDLDPVNML